MSDVVVRELSTVAECAAITPLTWQVWGPNAPVFSVDLLRAIGHTGGYLAGAFLDAGAGGQEAGAGEQEMVGFSLGLLADLNGARSLHSHATGVLAHARGLHVGLALKEHQRAWAHSRQILTVTWTFDPLVRRNATFNLLRLGARAAEYLEDFYGLLDDDLNGPDPSDRLFLVWDVEQPADPFDDALLVGAGRLLADLDAAPVLRDSDADVVLVATPADIEVLRRQDPSMASAWRLAQREALGTAMKAGRVVGFTKAGDYVVERGL